MKNFYIGATVENIHEDSERYGETATVISFGGHGIAVQYDDGYVGKAITASKYYRVLNDAPCGRSAGASEGSTMMEGIGSVLKAVKRMAMGANDKALIDSGLKDECGNYTCTAIALLNQNAAAADVALGTESVLISAANAVLADRKAKKDN